MNEWIMVMWFGSITSHLSSPELFLKVTQVFSVMSKLFGLDGLISITNGYIDYPASF